jgi:hypothetical protein
MFKLSFSKKSKRITFTPSYSGIKNILLIDDLKNKISIDYSVSLGEVVYYGKAKFS